MIDTMTATEFRAAIWSLGWTHDEAAARLNISRETVDRLCNGAGRGGCHRVSKYEIWQIALYKQIAAVQADARDAKRNGKDAWK